MNTSYKFSVAIVLAGIVATQTGISIAQVPPPASNQVGAPVATPPLPPGPGPGGPNAPVPPPGDVPPPPAPGPEAQQPPIDPKVAPVAVKTAADSAGKLFAGQVWARTAPRGEQQIEATIVFDRKAVARLEFDPNTGDLMARGQTPPAAPPVATPPGAPGTEGNGPDGRPKSPAPSGGDIGSVKARLGEIVESLKTGQGAEILGREGFWKVPLIYENRVVGELHLSADGTRILEDFDAARDSAIFARE